MSQPNPIKERTVTKTNLSPAQHAILAYAHQHAAGRIEWFPEHIKGGARAKVLDGLRARALIEQAGADLVIAPAGYAALGVEPPKVEAPGTNAADTEPAQRRTRDNSKQAQVIAMLKRPEGATIAQICEATGWQQHTVRGTFAGAFKKKLGLALASEKAQGGQRIYRIAA
jgi:hypothetical protein